MTEPPLFIVPYAALEMRVKKVLDDTPLAGLVNKDQMRDIVEDIVDALLDELGVVKAPDDDN